MEHPPRILHVEFKVDLEYARKEFGRVLKAIERWARPCMHGKRSVAFVIVTKETDVELVQRLRPTLDDTTLDYRIHEAPRVVVARHGSVDTFVTRVAEAWAEIRQRRNPNYMRQSQFRRSERRVDNRQGGTFGEVPVEPLSSRHPPKHPNRPYRNARHGD